MSESNPTMDIKPILEAVLFAAPKPLTPAELVAVFRSAAEQNSQQASVTALGAVREQDITAALEELAAEYRSRARGFYPVCVAGAWQFVTAPDYAPWLRALLGTRPRPARLTQPALETLAIIAYRQPITRAEIEEIRGVNVDGVMQTLQERGLIEVVGRADAPGRPPLYGTTRQFLEYFGLRSLDELPGAHELRRRAQPNPQTAQATAQSPATIQEQGSLPVPPAEPAPDQGISVPGPIQSSGTAAGPAGVETST